MVTTKLGGSSLVVATALFAGVDGVNTKLEHDENVKKTNISKKKCRYF